MGRTRALYRNANGCMILDRRTGSSSLPLAYSLLHAKATRGVRPCTHKPITPSQMASLVCCVTAAPYPYWYEHRQSCPGVTQAVSYEPCLIHSTRRWSRLSCDIRALVAPFSTRVPDQAVEHTFVQPIDCLMRNPYPGDTYWVSGTSGWREGVTAPSLCLLVSVPGCQPRSEPATCSRTLPAGRKFTPASTSETGSNSSASRETPPLTLFVAVGPCLPPPRL